MANADLIATVKNPGAFYKLKSIIGKTFLNDGEAILEALNGCIKEGTLEYIGQYRFLATFISEGWSEIEIICRPTSVEGTELEVLNINIYGENVR